MYAMGYIRLLVVYFWLPKSTVGLLLGLEIFCSKNLCRYSTQLVRSIPPWGSIREPKNHPCDRLVMWNGLSH